MTLLCACVFLFVSSFFSCSFNAADGVRCPNYNQEIRMCLLRLSTFLSRKMNSIDKTHFVLFLCAIWEPNFIAYAIRTIWTSTQQQHSPPSRAKCALALFSITTPNKCAGKKTMTRWFKWIYVWWERSHRSTKHLRHFTFATRRKRFTSMAKWGR